MHTTRLYGWGLLILLLTALWITPASAIPAFARKYGYNCTMCHSGFPRLNDYGLRYRQNGYQLPGRENEDKTVLESPAPVAFRTSVGYTSDQFKNTPDAEETNQFQVNGLDVLSGGLLGRNIGYILAFTPQLSGSRFVQAQAGKIDLGNVVFSNLCGNSGLDARVGQLEGAYTAFSVKRQLSVSPYEIYNFTFPGGIAFADSQAGIEVSKFTRFSGWHLAAGLVDGGSSDAGDGPADLYVRAAKVFGRGEGQTAGQRLGVVGYFGRARPEGVSTGDRRNFTRYGVDASLNMAQWNLEAQYLRARDSGELWDTDESVKYSGGFAQLNYLAFPTAVAFLRYDRVDTPDILLDADISRWTVGGRYYPVDNLALHVEFSRRTQQAPGANPRETFATARLDYAF